MAIKLSVGTSFLLLLLAACTTAPPGKGVPYDVFPETRNLTGRVLPLDTAVFRYPFRIRVQGDKAVMLDLHGTDHLFHVFSHPQGHYLSSFGKRGEAPHEMISAENVRWKEDALWVLDADKSEITRLGLSGDSLLRGETVSLDKNILRALDFVVIDDAAFLIPDYSGDARFCQVSLQGRLLGKFGSIPSADEEALRNARPALAQAWRSFIDYNPRNGVLAAVTQLGEVVEVYNLRDSTHVVRIGPHGEPEFLVSEGYGLPMGIMGFSDVQVTDSAIYTVFHGRPFKEIAASVRKGTKLPDGGQYIYVFSLDGEPLCKYVLDHAVYGISVDEEKGIIIATDVNRDDPIIEYRIKDLCEYK